MAVENLIISIKAEDMASNVIKGVASSIRTLANDLLYTASIQIADGIIDATKALGSFQMELELTDIAFTQMVKGADRGRASLEEYTDVARALRNELHDLAAETPFSFQDVNRGARQLMAYGFGVKEIEPMLRTIGDAAAAFGGSPVAIYRTIRALGQIKAYGRLKGQELLQLTEVGIPAHEILREELNLSSEQLSRIADQHIPAQEAIDAILRGIEQRYAGMMEVQSRTMQGSIAAIKDNLMLVGTQLTHSLYNEVRDEVRSFRLSLDEYKNMTRVAGWRGLFGQEKYYEKNGKEIDTSKMNQQEYDNLRARLEKGEVRRVFDTTHYTDSEGKLVNTASMSPEEFRIKMNRGVIEQKDSLIPSDWQDSIFRIGDYFLMLIDNIKELGSAFMKLWKDIGGNNILMAVGFEIFKIINGFIILTTLVLEVADSFVVFIDKITSFGAIARVVESAIVGIGAALAMTAAVNVVQNFLVFINTFRIMIGYAGIVGVHVGLLVTAVHLFGQTSSDAAIGVGALGTALLLYINRAQIAAAVTLAWAGVMRVVNTVVATARAVWTALIAVKTTIMGVITVFNAFRASVAAGMAISLALRNSMLLLNMVFGGSRLAQIALTAAVATGTTVMMLARGAFIAVQVATEAFVGVLLVLEGSITAASLSTTLWTTVTNGAAAVTGIFSGAVTVLSTVMTAFRAKVLLIVAAIVTVIAILSSLSDGFANLVSRIINSVVDMFARVINFILSVCGEFIKEIGQMFFGGFEWIGKNISEIWHGTFDSLLNTIKDFVKKALLQLGPLGELVVEIGEKLGNAWDKFKNGQGTPLERLKKLVYEGTDFDPGGALNLDQFSKNYTTSIPQTTTGAGKDKKSKEKKDPLQSWEKEVSLGEYFAYTSSSLEGVGKAFDDMLPSLLQATKSFNDFSGSIDDFYKYALTKSGNGINNSIVYDPNDENFALSRGNIILYKGEDGKLHSALYMGDNKIRMGVNEVQRKFVEESVNTSSSKMKVNDVVIEPQGRGECTIKSAKAFLGYYKQDNEGLTFGNWASRMRDFVGNNGYDIVDYAEYEQRITRHFAQGGGPAMVYFTGGAGGHELNPNQNHAFIIAGQDEQGNWIVKDPAGGVTKVFHNLRDTWDESRSPTKDAETGAALYLKENYSGNVKSSVENLFERFLQGLISQESNGNDNVVSSEGAMFKWQIMPESFEQWKFEAGLGDVPFTAENAEKVARFKLKQYWDIASSITDDQKRIMESVAAGWYAGGDNVKLWANHAPKAFGPKGFYNWDAPQPNGPSVVGYMQGVLSKMPDSVNQMTEKVLIETSEFVGSSIESIKDKMVGIVDSNFSGETKRIEDKVLKEKAKLLDKQYKEYEKINNAVKEYTTYMRASQLQLDEINGNFTEYRKKVMEVRSEFAKIVEQSQKLVGQGLSREYAEKMVARAKKVADAILKEFERVRKIKFEIDFKTNQSKIAELNHDFDKSLSLQKEAETLQLDADAFEAGKEILKDASAIPEIMAEYAKVRNTGQSFGEFMQDLLSVDEPFTETNSKFADFIKNNEGLWEYWVTLVDAKSQELKQKFELLGKTIYSRTAESYANQGDLQGLLGYLQSPEGEEQRRLEQSFTIQQEWCNRVIDMYRYLGQEVDQAMLTLHDSIIDHGTSAIMDFIKGTKSAKEAFSEFALSVMEDVVKMVLKMAMMEAVSGIFGGLFGGSKSSGFGTGMMWGNLGLVKGGAVKKGQTALVGEEGPELLSITSGKSALDSPKSMVIGAKGPEVITMPYTGYVIPNEDLLKMVGYYSDDKAIPSYMISGFRAEGGKVEKDKAYIVGEKGPEVFSPGSSGNIFSNEQVNSTLTNLDRISRSGSMASPYENTPQQTIPPVVVNLDNKSGTQMTAQAESNFDGDQWVVSVVLDAVNRNVGGLRNVIGNVSGRR